MDIDELNQLINQSAAMSLSDRQKAVRWFAHQNDLIVQDVFKLKKNHFYRLKSEERISDLVLLDLIAFYLAIKEMIAQSKTTNRKNRSGSFGFLRKIGETRAKQLRKPRFNLKREKLLNLQGIIKDLLEEKNYSFREVANYLKTYHRFEISHTSVREFYQTIKEVKCLP